MTRVFFPDTTLNNIPDDVENVHEHHICHFLYALLLTIGYCLSFRFFYGLRCYWIGVFLPSFYVISLETSSSGFLFYFRNFWRKFAVANANERVSERLSLVFKRYTLRTDQSELWICFRMIGIPPSPTLLRVNAYDKFQVGLNQTMSLG